MLTLEKKGRIQNIDLRANVKGKLASCAWKS